MCRWCCGVLIMVVVHPSTQGITVVHAFMQADEELLILEGVDMFGFGNWAAVAEHVGTKGAEDCQQHYTFVYINSPAFPEPTPLASMANVNQMQVRTSSCIQFPA